MIYKPKVGISSCPSGIRCTRIYRNFFILLVMVFFSKKKTTMADFCFWKHKSPPFGFEFFFFKLPLIIFLSKPIAFGLTIPIWYNTKVFDIFFQKYFKKYFQYSSALPFWNRETKCYKLALIKKDLKQFEKNIFSNRTLVFSKMKIGHGGFFLKKKSMTNKIKKFLYGI